MPQPKEIPFRSREDVEARAQSLLKQHGLQTAPIDPISLASVLGIRVYNAKFHDETISGMLAKRGPSLTMLINASDSAHRKRFTIAHEIGHRVLEHFPSSDEHTDHATDLFRNGLDSNSDSPERAEIQANQFAASLLMPADLVRQQFQITKDVPSLARTFQVSQEAMGYRLNTLKLL